MNLRYTILYVPDVREALDFYCRAFGTRTGFIHESGDYGQLDTGETKLAFASRELVASMGRNPGSADPDSPAFEIAFETSDVESALTRAVKAGAKVVQEVRREPWGQTTSYVSDPNGFLVEICSPVSSPDTPV